MLSSSPEKYIGNELELFAQAHHWKAYLSAVITPHLGANVLEVGAGLGGTTATLTHSYQGRWLCLEPDPALAHTISQAVATGQLPSNCRVSIGTIASLAEQHKFDSILYIDVLEHIRDDAAEAQLAASRLSVGGKLIVLSPAYEWLFSPFDEAVGHFRRYNKRTLVRAIPKSLHRVQLSYLDCVGLLASAGNRLIARSSSPSAGQIRLWDRAMVPLSRVFDPIIAHSFGKSLFGVWEKR